jgi:hypothetical protein
VAAFLFMVSLAAAVWPAWAAADAYSGRMK